MKKLKLSSFSCHVAVSLKQTLDTFLCLAGGFNKQLKQVQIIIISLHENEKANKKNFKQKAITYLGVTKRKSG